MYGRGRDASPARVGSPASRDSVSPASRSARLAPARTIVAGTHDAHDLSRYGAGADGTSSGCCGARRRWPAGWLTSHLSAYAGGSRRVVGPRDRAAIRGARPRGTTPVPRVVPRRRRQAVRARGCRDRARALARRGRHARPASCFDGLRKASRASGATEAATAWRRSRSCPDPRRPRPASAFESFHARASGPPMRRRRCGPRWRRRARAPGSRTPDRRGNGVSHRGAGDRTSRSRRSRRTCSAGRSGVGRRFDAAREFSAIRRTRAPLARSSNASPATWPPRPAGERGPPVRSLSPTTRGALRGASDRGQDVASRAGECGCGRASPCSARADAARRIATVAPPVIAAEALRRRAIWASRPPRGA